MTTQSSAPDAVEGARSSATTADGSTADVNSCAHTKYVGCPPCEHDVVDEPTTCARGCRDGLVRVLSASGDDTEVDTCPCQR